MKENQGKGRQGNNDPRIATPIRIVTGTPDKVNGIASHKAENSDSHCNTRKRAVGRDLTDMNPAMKMVEKSHIELSRLHQPIVVKSGSRVLQVIQHSTDTAPYLQAPEIQDLHVYFNLTGVGLTVTAAEVGIAWPSAAGRAVDDDAAAAATARGRPERAVSATLSYKYLATTAGGRLGLDSACCSRTFSGLLA